MFIPQWQTKTPILGGSQEMSLSSGKTFSFTKVFRTGANPDAAALAAADASITEQGISFGP